MQIKEKVPKFPIVGLWVVDLVQFSWPRWILGEISFCFEVLVGNCSSYFVWVLLFSWVAFNWKKNKELGHISGSLPLRDVSISLFFDCIAYHGYLLYAIEECLIVFFWKYPSVALLFVARKSNWFYNLLLVKVVSDHNIEIAVFVFAELGW